MQQLEVEPESALYQARSVCLIQDLAELGVIGLENRIPELHPVEDIEDFDSEHERNLIVQGSRFLGRDVEVIRPRAFQRAIDARFVAEGVRARDRKAACVEPSLAG